MSSLRMAVSPLGEGLLEVPRGTGPLRLGGEVGRDSLSEWYHLLIGC